MTFFPTVGSVLVPPTQILAIPVWQLPLNFRYDEGTDGRLLLVSAVPEPAALGLLAIALAGLFARRRTMVPLSVPVRTLFRSIAKRFHHAVLT